MPSKSGCGSSLTVVFFAYQASYNAASYLDKVNGHVGDGVPRLGRVHELGVLDLVLDVHVLVERELAREAHVHDDPRRPHVQGPKCDT